MRLLLAPIVVQCATLAGVILACPAAVAAFCRTTTVEPEAVMGPQPCPSRGLPLFWPMRELSYTINQRGLPDLGDDELRDALERSFGAWTEVHCDGERIDLSIDQIEEFTDQEPSSKELEPRANVVAYVPAEEWVEANLDKRAFAITNLRFNARTGHILGADMLFNGAKDPFIVCPDDGCDEDVIGTDLPNVVTHEAGHFLGLAHSDDPDSTMWYDATGTETDKRSLEADDRAGVCAIYGPDAVLGPPPSGSKQEQGLLCRAGAAAAPGRAGWAILGLGLVLAGRRRRSRCR